jgi:hypothetical protein
MLLSNSFDSAAAGRSRVSAVVVVNFDKKKCNEISVIIAVELNLFYQISLTYGSQRCTASVKNNIIGASACP